MNREELKMIIGNILIKDSEITASDARKILESAEEYADSKVLETLEEIEKVNQYDTENDICEGDRVDNKIADIRDRISKK